jgi:D-alanyl-lipoteichoic acid acyltransferase DltB (MBOAT superfamily)
MLFTSPLYGLFLGATWAFFWVLRRWGRVRALALVVASYAFYFYGTWDAARSEPVPVRPIAWALLCLGIIFVGSTVDFFVGLGLARSRQRWARNALLLTSIVYYLGVLSIFKYWSFAADAVVSLSAMLGLHLSVPHLRLVLPFGISFFTFETMSYTIDVWRGDLQPTRRYVDYLLFVCFFPHLVAGPIVRPSQMLPQLMAEPRADAAMQAMGLWRIAIGLGKKIVIGDTLARALVDRVFETPERFTALEVLLAAYGYAAQIYADFSGYSDIAIGSAALFGYELPENFAAPYLASNLQDFWRRWHITLSTWLRDYLYKPLGGSRRGSMRTYGNLLVTMVLGGLWHGASWTFVIWGAIHGCALALTRMWQRGRASTSREASTDRRTPRAGAPRWVGILLTFHFVCFAWVFFRAPTLAHAALVFEQIARGRWAIDHIAPSAVLVLSAAALLVVAPGAWEGRLRGAFVRAPAFVQGLALAAAAMGLHWAAGAGSEPFVYGQF